MRDTKTYSVERSNATVEAASVEQEKKSPMEKRAMVATTNAPETIIAAEVASTKQEKETIMKKEVKVATENASELNNATEVARVKQYNATEEVLSTDLEDCGCSEDETPITWKARINNERKEIIIGFTECNIPLSKKKAELLKLADKQNLLPVKYNLVRAELFWREHYPIADRNGYEIKEGTPDVYVLCPQPDTNIRIFVDEELTDVEIIECKSVQDWAKKVGTTNQLCQGFDKVKDVAVAALATGNEAAKQVAHFSMENNVPESVSEAFFLTRFTPKNLRLMEMGYKPKLEITLGRTLEDAKRLFDGINKTFGEAEGRKRYAIRAINSLLDGDDYDLDTVLEALRTIPAEKVTYSKLKKCGEKENCIVKVLNSWIIQMQRDATKTAA